MSGVQQREVVEADAGMRLDRWFKQHFPQVTHGQLEKMLRKGEIRVDGGRVKANRRVEVGETIRIPPISATDPPRRTQGLSPGDRDYIRNLVIAETPDMVILNKPFGIAVQGGTNTTRHIDGMLDALAKDGERPRLVHRLDRDTGGVLILARTRKAAARLTEQFQRHDIAKEYWALVVGLPRPASGTIDLPIAKKMVTINTADQERMLVAAEGEESKRALTDYQLVEDAGGRASFVALRPLTGRTHQLRVHMAALGHPIVGDGKYGGERARMEGVSGKMHLFCRAMAVPRPGGGVHRLVAPLSGHMHETWKFFSFPKDAEVVWPER